mgnify:CR=1 FL=1
MGCRRWLSLRTVQPSRTRFFLDALGGPGRRRVAVAGDSAGGNIAAVVAQQLTLAHVPLRAQLLAYPYVDVAEALSGIQSQYDTALLSTHNMQWFAQQYLSNASLNAAHAGAV